MLVNSKAEIQGLGVEIKKRGEFRGILALLQDDLSTISKLRARQGGDDMEFEANARASVDSKAALTSLGSRDRYEHKTWSEDEEDYNERDYRSEGRQAGTEIIPAFLNPNPNPSAPEQSPRSAPECGGRASPLFPPIASAEDYREVPVSATVLPVSKGKGRISRLLMDLNGERQQIRDEQRRQTVESDSVPFSLRRANSELGYSSGLLEKKQSISIPQTIFRAAPDLDIER